MHAKNLLYIFIFGVIILSCNKYEDLRISFLDNDLILQQGVDTFTLNAHPYRRDSAVVYQPSYQSGSFVIGKMNDPMFGMVESMMVSQLSFIPEREKKYLQNVDSIIFSLKYDTSSFYGKVNSPMSYEVFQLETELKRNLLYFNNDQIKLGAKLGEKNNFIPGKKDSIPIKINNENIKLPPQLRIALEKDIFINQLKSIPDTGLLNVDTFQYLFKGIAVKAKSSEGMLGVLPRHSESKITIYYRSDTNNLQFVFNMGALNIINFPIFQTDMTGSPAEQYWKGIIPSDSLIFVQSLNGPEVELAIPYSDSWEGKFLNYAILDLTVAELPNDQLVNNYPMRIVTLHDLNIGHEGEVADVFRAKGNDKYISSDYFFYRDYFGGIPIQKTFNGITKRHYYMNITEHFRNAQRKKQNIRLRLSSYFKTEAADRTIFYGPKHSQFPAKLRLTFSK